MKSLKKLLGKNLMIKKMMKKISKKIVSIARKVQLVVGRKAIRVRRNLRTPLKRVITILKLRARASQSSLRAGNPRMMIQISPAQTVNLRVKGKVSIITMHRDQVDSQVANSPRKLILMIISLY